MLTNAGFFLSRDRKNPELLGTLGFRIYLLLEKLINLGSSARRSQPRVRRLPVPSLVGSDA